jgi:hypothetical protein
MTKEESQDVVDTKPHLAAKMDNIVVPKLQLATLNKWFAKDHPIFFLSMQSQCSPRQRQKADSQPPSLQI